MKRGNFGTIVFFIVLVVLSFFAFGEAKAAIGDNVSGWAWSETIGWVSFNSTNCDVDGDGRYEGVREGESITPAPIGCPPAQDVFFYGVKVDHATGIFSGYAWSERIGWVSFNRAETGDPPQDDPCPDGSCIAKVDYADNFKVAGWARALAAQDGWDGWIKFQGTAQDSNPYWVFWNRDTKEFEGWAWGSDVVGWVSFNCINESACATSAYKVKADIDITPPVIITFAIAPQSPGWANSARPSVTVTWDVSDQGNSHLDRVRAYRAAFGVGCNDADKSGCLWIQAGNDAVAPLDLDRWDCDISCTDRIVDNPPSGTWWYGMHVLDKAQNETVEPDPPGPKKALVDTNEPNSQIQSPASNSWFSNDFNLDTLDEDLDSGLDTTQCQYKIIPFEDTTGDGIADTERTSSGWLSRICNAPPSAPSTSITVGSTDFCKYQAKSSCWVYIRSKDMAGNLHTSTQPAGSIKLFNIDWTQPQPSKLYITANEEDQAYPIEVQLNQSNIYKVHVTDNLKVSGCSLYIDGIDQGPMTPIVPGCEKDCTFTSAFAFTGTGTYHNNYARCKDAADNSKPGTSVDIEVKTLSVDLTAIPSAGSTNTLFDLVGTVSGTMTGNINYKFDCTSDGTWELEMNNSAINPFTAVDLCQYSSPATYTAKVFMQRGVGTAESTVDISVSVNSIPSAIHLSVDDDNPTDYCGVTGYPPVRVNWEFSDDDPGDTQSAYQIQVFRDADGVKVVDTDGDGARNTGSTQSYVFQSSGEQLLWNTAYTWQVRVWDNLDDVSLFTSGPPFTTVKNHYPVPDFTWIPALPGAQESVQFTDQTNFDEGGVNNSQASTNQNWFWTFGDGSSSSTQNPTHAYNQTGAFGVTLQSGDDVGSCLSSQQTVNVSIPFPEWQEISPF